MSIATKCVCGHSVSGICLDDIKQCTLIVKTDFDRLCIESDCTEEEKKMLRAFLFAFRHKDLNMYMIENTVKKYSHLL